MRPIPAATILLAAVSLAACAGQQPMAPQASAPPEVRSPTPGSLASIDEDGDGFITGDELSGHYRNEFVVADVDQNDRLSGDEIGPDTEFYTQAESMGRDPAAEDFGLTSDEYLAAREAEFEAADLDGDGRVSRAEFERMLANR